MKKFAVLLSLILLTLSHAQTSYPVTITHEVGETTIEARPERIVTLSEEVAELVAVLGEKPVGHATRRPTGAGVGDTLRVNTPLAEALSEAAFAGEVGKPSLEVIVGTDPDLILVYTNEGNFMANGGYEQLSAIAPTLAFSFASDGEISWHEPLRKTALALGKSEAAEAYIADFNAQLDELATSFAPIVEARPTMSFFFWPSPDANFVLGPNHYFAPVLKRLGFDIHVPEGVELQGGVSGMMSLEALANLESDVVMALRLVPAVGEEPAPVPAEDLVRQSGIPYVRYPLPPLEGQAGPITDLVRARTLLELMR